MNKLQLNGTSIWDQVFMYHEEMRNSARLLYLYLLTNTISNIAGIYKISKKRMLFDLNTTDAILEWDFKLLKYFKQVYRCGSYIIIKDASLFIQKPTKAIIKEWNKIIDNLPIKVKEKLERIKYKKIDGKPYKIEINQDEKPMLFEVNELKECYTKLLKEYKQKKIKTEDKIEDKKDGVQKESEGINPPKPIRKELIIEEEEEEIKKGLKVPESQEIQEEIIEDVEEKIEENESVEDILEDEEDDPSEWYFRKENIQHASEIKNEFTDEDDPYYIPTEEDYLKEWEKNNFNHEDEESSFYEDGSEASYEDEADSSYMEDNSVAEEEVVEDEVIMGLNCNNKDKIIQNVDSFMDEDFYRQAYKPIADFIIKKNNRIIENIGNEDVEKTAYFDLFCNVLETKNDDYLAAVILDFLQYKGFYKDINVITFARAYNGEGKQFINSFRENTRQNHNKFYSKKAMVKLFNILYGYLENGEDKVGGLYCWYSDIRKKEKAEEKVEELSFA